MENSFFENLISNFWYALSALILATIIFHTLLVYPKNLSKRQWKQIDYFWISLTALGLIGTTRVAEKSVLENKSVQVQWLMTHSAKRLLSNISDHNNAGICRTFIKTEYSPDNLQEVQKNFDKACEWKKKVSKIVLKSIDTINLKTIDTTKIPDLPNNEPMINEYKMNVIFDIKNYNRWANELRLNYKKREKSVSEIVLIYFSPLLLIVGLAIRITKVTGELMYEKKKNEV